MQLNEENKLMFSNYLFIEGIYRQFQDREEKVQRKQKR